MLYTYVYMISNLLTFVFSQKKTQNFADIYVGLEKYYGQEKYDQ